jgi:hypothetical protein
MVLGSLSLGFGFLTLVSGFLIIVLDSLNKELGLLSGGLDFSTAPEDLLVFVFSTLRFLNLTNAFSKKAMSIDFNEFANNLLSNSGIDFPCGVASICDIKSNFFTKAI